MLFVNADTKRRKRIEKALKKGSKVPQAIKKEMKKDKKQTICVFLIKFLQKRIGIVTIINSKIKKYIIPCENNACMKKLCKAILVSSKFLPLPNPNTKQDID